MNQFILALFSMTDKLKTSTLFHLLKGKRTSAIMSYAFFTNLLPFLGCQVDLSLKVFENAIATLENEGLLVKSEAATYRITAKGQSQLNLQLRESLLEVDYFNFGRSDENCFRLLAYFIQQVSKGQENLRPLETSPLFTRPVAQLITQQKASPDILYEELAQLFNKLTQVAGDFLAQQFSGATVLAKTAYQIMPDEYQKEPWSQLYQASCLHPLLKEIKKAQKKTLCYQLLKGLLQQNYNKSMLYTRQLLLEEKSIGEVAQIRDLKVGTISDHIVEWSLYEESFPFERFISKASRENLDLLAAKEDVYAMRYGAVNEKFPLDFIEFRLYQIKQKRDENYDIRG